MGTQAPGDCRSRRKLELAPGTVCPAEALVTGGQGQLESLGQGDIPCIVQGHGFTQFPGAIRERFVSEELDGQLQQSSMSPVGVRGVHETPGDTASQHLCDLDLEEMGPHEWARRDDLLRPGTSRIGRQQRIGHHRGVQQGSVAPEFAAAFSTANGSQDG